MIPPQTHCTIKSLTNQLLIFKLGFEENFHLDPDMVDADWGVSTSMNPRLVAPLSMQCLVHMPPLVFALCGAVYPAVSVTILDQRIPSECPSGFLVSNTQQRLFCLPVSPI